MKNKQEEEEVMVLTPWGCLMGVLNDYGFNTDHITGKIGEHMVEDFMDLMVATGHLAKVEGEGDTP